MKQITFPTWLSLLLFDTLMYLFSREKQLKAMKETAVTLKDSVYSIFVLKVNWVNIAPFSFVSVFLLCLI